MTKPRAMIISGPTASGKSRRALELALEFMAKGVKAEIISADSAQVYRGMDIGTDKLRSPERMGVPHHLIDMVDPDQHFDAVMFRTTAMNEIERINHDQGAAILVGGTGFWIRALVFGLFEGPARDKALREELKQLARDKGGDHLHAMLVELDPEAARRIHPHDLTRLVRSIEVFRLTGRPLSEHFKNHLKAPSVDALHLALNPDRALLHDRINQRVDEMIAKGLVDEVKMLREKGFGPGLESQKIIGYRQVHQHLDNLLTLDQSVHEIKKQTRHYARRQLVWLRGQPGINWLDAQKDRAVLSELAFKFMEGSR